MGYFALGGLVFLTAIGSSQQRGVAMGLFLFILSILPIVLPFRGFRLLYGLMAFMVSLIFVFAFFVQISAWTAADLPSGIVITLTLLGYLGASSGLALTSVQSSDPKRFTLI